MFPNFPTTKGMKPDIVLHSASYVLAMCSGMVITKVFNYYFDYNDYMYTLIMYAIFAPFNFLPFLYVSRGVSLDYKIYLPFFIPAIIYAVETILLSFTLNHMELGLYVIARTSYSIFNYVSYKYIMKRQLNKWYYVGVSLLLMSYAFIIIDFSSEQSYHNLLMFCICLSTGMTTSICNTLAELQLSTLKEHKLQYTLLNNAIFQMTSFTVNIPLGMAELNRPKFINKFRHNSIFVLLSVITACSFQLYSTNKFFILNDPNVNGSMIVSSLDLLRRIVLNTVSYTLLNEPITAYNMTGNGLLLLASASLFYSSNSNSGVPTTKSNHPFEDEPTAAAVSDEEAHEDNLLAISIAECKIDTYNESNIIRPEVILDVSEFENHENLEIGGKYEMVPYKSKSF